MAKKYYSLKKILEVDAVYNIIYGKRSNGKSYAVKHFSVQNAINNPDKEKFVYLRRYSLDVRAGDVALYFNDLPIEKMTNGEYKDVEVRQKKINLVHYNDKNKVDKRLHIGYVMYLSGVEHFKSLSYPDVENMIFEEFVTNEGYLIDEPTKLMNIISTVFRDRKGKIFMIGNTVNRICPYFSEWQLINVPEQEQNTIDVYTVKYNDLSIQIACEYCGDSDTNATNNFFFGRQADSIIKGNWEVKSFPKPPKEEGHSLQCRFLLMQGQFNYCINLMLDCNGYPYLKITPAKIENALSELYTLALSREFYTSPKVLKTFAGNPIGRKLRELYASGKICYSDNLTGTEFNNILKEWQIW